MLFLQLSYLSSLLTNLCIPTLFSLLSDLTAALRLVRIQTDRLNVNGDVVWQIAYVLLKACACSWLTNQVCACAPVQELTATSMALNRRCARSRLHNRLLGLPKR